MDWKLFFSTFVLIFLAELGDKTQLAAMARASSGGHAPWVVFGAASMALVASTAIAVAGGTVLERYVPAHYIKLVSAALFLGFGLWIVFDVVRGGRPVAQLDPTEEEAVLDRARRGHLIGFVLDQALAFERAAHEDYHALAADTAHPGLKRLFLELAAEEEEHIRHLERGRAAHEPVLAEAHGAEALPAGEELGHDVAQHDRVVLAHAREHEEATCRFYREVARTVHVPALRDLFAALASHGQRHLDRLEATARELAS